MGKKKTKTNSENYQELRDELKIIKEYVRTQLSEYAPKVYVDCQVWNLEDQVETIKIHNRYYLAAIAAVLLSLLVSNMYSCMSSCPSCHRNQEPPVTQNQVSKIQDRASEYIDGTILNIDKINDNSCFRIRADRSDKEIN